MIYLDNHATTRCDPRVVEAMLPFLTQQYANPHSSGHQAGRDAADAVTLATESIAACLGAPADSVIVTSGATESTNLALRGVCLHPRQKRRHLIVGATEHPAVGDVATDLERAGFQVTRLRVDREGTVDLNQLSESISEHTALVSDMWANNEIGTVAPMREIAELCHQHGALLHSDATQAVGRIPVDMADVDVDLVSMSAHKFYGPKGVGVLVAGNGKRRARLRPQIIGGGQQRGQRSGTVSPANLVAMATALQIAREEMHTDADRVSRLRERLYRALSAKIDGIQVNGVPITEAHVLGQPSVSSPANALAMQNAPATLDGLGRLPGNLNIALPEIEGEAWLAGTPGVAFSSGAACSSAEPKPSHVLTAIGLDESTARRSVRFGIGRFNTEAEIDIAVDQLIASYQHLQTLA